MSTVTVPAVAPATDRIDADLALASVALGVARASFTRCPSADNERALAGAVAAVDRLLDERLGARA